MVKKRKKKRNKLVVFILVLILVLCGSFVYLLLNKNDNTNKSNDDTKVLKEEKTQEVKKLKIVNPDSNSRNIAVMINNISTVWGYQSGLQDAYIVYEMIVEGGISRLMAVYKDVNTERIGSVRSSRHYFLDYVLENDAIYTHVGGSDQALSDIRYLKLADLDGSTIWRDKSLNLSSEHTAFTSIDKILEQANKKKYRTTTEQKLLLNYSIDQIDLSTINGAKEAKEVYISYSSGKSTSFTYDEKTRTYKRFQNNKAHIDYVTKEQYTAKNIITYQVANSTIPGDTKGRQTLSTIGNGEGYYISNGYAIPITWEKKSRESQTIYRYMDGSELKVNDGNTYIQIQPKNRELTIN